MSLDILLNPLIRHTTDRRTKIPPCPKMLSPVSLPQVGKLLLHLAGRSTLDLLHQLRWTDRRRTRHQYMHVVLANMTLHDSNIQRLTLLTDQLSDATRHLPGQYMIPILRPSIPDGTECRRSYANRVDIRPWLGTSFSSKDLASPMIQTESRSSGRRGFSTGCMEIKLCKTSVAWPESRQNRKGPPPPVRLV